MDSVNLLAIVFLILVNGRSIYEAEAVLVDLAGDRDAVDWANTSALTMRPFGPEPLISSK